MTADAINDFLDALAERIAAKVDARRQDAKNPNELLTVAQVSDETGLCETIVRQLIDAGTLQRAPDIRERRVSRRELERYCRKEKP